MADDQADKVVEQRDSVSESRSSADEAKSILQNQADDLRREPAATDKQTSDAQGKTETSQLGSETGTGIDDAAQKRSDNRSDQLATATGVPSAAGRADAEDKLRASNGKDGQQDLGLPAVDLYDSKRGLLPADQKGAPADAAARDGSVAEPYALNQGGEIVSPDKKILESVKEIEKKAEPAKALTEQQEKDAVVRRHEGPYQVANRILGKDATHEQKKTLVAAMKEQYKEETGGKDPSMSGLKVGQSLLNEGNFDKVMDRITDKKMHDSITSKFGKAESKLDKPADAPYNRQRPEEKRLEEKKTEGKQAEDHKPPEVKKVGPLGSGFVPVDKAQPEAKTIASVYDKPQETASGRYFNSKEMTAAIKPELAKQLGLKFGDVVQVTHQGKSVDVTYTDAGPFVKGRGVDLSTEAGRRLGITVAGKGIGDITFKKIGSEPNFRKARP